LKLLLDTCVWGRAREALETAGHELICAADWSKDPGDEEILQRAEEGGRVLVTLDKDFGTLAVFGGQRHAGIVRLVGIPARAQAGACLNALGRFAADLAGGAIVTVEPGRIRVRLRSPSGSG
jgi:predicted nuclease of predicted toxin-antitoxin system